MGVDHNNVPALAAMRYEVVGELVRALIDLLVGEDTLGGAGARGFDNAWSLGVLLGIGGEDFVDCWARLSDWLLGEVGSCLPPR